MISYFEANLNSFAGHHVGNHLQDEGYSLSEESVIVTDEIMNRLLMQFFLSPFEKTSQVYEFMHPSGDLSLNDIYSLCNVTFFQQESFISASKNIAKYLYGISNHPKIKSGELYVALFDNIQIEGELLQAIGIFKSESKESYLKVNPAIGRFDMSYEQEAINISKLDKGCLIFNTNADGGYKVAVIDNGTKTDNGYWVDEFLQLKVRQDNYRNTADALSIVKEFVKNKLDDEFELGQSDKADLLNRATKYFKEKESFDLVEFTGEVLGNDDAVKSFNRFKENQSEEYEMHLPDSFEISDAAVKKALPGLKSTITLDKNFKIQVMGSKDLIERGYDNEKALNYYKVYFKQETA
jgi:hypothetical protein